ncbi:MAG: hypothetical protein PVI28_00010 [Gammaproteobacteria bacterium]|jgi:hypothetical protein
MHPGAATVKKRKLIGLPPYSQARSGLVDASVPFVGSPTRKPSIYNQSIPCLSYGLIHKINKLRKSTDFTPVESPISRQRSPVEAPGWLVRFQCIGLPLAVDALEKSGMVCLSGSFYMREFLYSETANVHGLQNIPDNPDLAIEVGRKLCEELLEPLNATFGRVAVRSSFCSCELNKFCNEHGYNCAENEANYAGHLWDRVDSDGRKGATACIVLPWFADRYERGADQRSLAYWIHDHLPYSELQFFPALCAFNISWRGRMGIKYRDRFG